eukprot:TRINITY_DN29675_c0_g1_i1.p1 TRINITY_DN29675_c0_g1~~TRINITY_DN29675_c0_g1_i1.p1  ORF type:complete len:533 (-),score=76.61 TRINITY_DN29675_c0_g1_i1:132-1730(-)
MAGFGLKLDIDMKAVQDLPTGMDSESVHRRRKMFQQADMSGNGILSLAECDRLIAPCLRIRGLDGIKPVINRAFHAARDIVPPVGDFSLHYIDFQEFRYFLIYLQHYLDLFVVFEKIDQASAGGYKDRRLSFKDFEKAVPTILKWGVRPEVAAKLRKDPAAVFRDMDDNGGGVVLFDEFAHWALHNHIHCLDSEDSSDMAEALDVLKKQKPNLCGKDLTAIRAEKARYRADGPIPGQGCARGDKELAGAYSSLPHAAKELAAGRHYPGGAAGWKASFERVEESSEEAKNGPPLCNCGCNRPAFGRFSTCCTKCRGPDGPHARDCLGKGYANCVNECGRPQFGRFETCCSHCKSSEGPHARDCFGKSSKQTEDAVSATGRRSFHAHPSEGSSNFTQSSSSECINGCGRARFGRFKTCCKHCCGVEGPHARDCGSSEPSCASSSSSQHGSVADELAKLAKLRSDSVLTEAEFEVAKARLLGAEAPPFAPASLGVTAAARCASGCGRKPYRQFKTCCTRCNGPDGPHASDCGSKS